MLRQLTCLILLILLLCLHSSCDVLGEDLRTWTSADGKFKVSARFVDADKANVRLRKSDGKVITVPLSRISDEDRAYIINVVESPRREAKPQDDFEVDGVLTIAAPGNGFTWRQATEVEQQGVKMRVLVCSKEGSTTAATLLVEHRTAETEGHRVAAIKGHYNGLVTSLQNGEFKELKGTRPEFTPPIPDKVTSKFSGKKPDGSPAEIRLVSIFGENIYSFTVIAADAAEADRLLQMVDTLEEVSD